MWAARAQPYNDGTTPNPAPPGPTEEITAMRHPFRTAAAVLAGCAGALPLAAHPAAAFTPCSPTSPCYTWQMRVGSPLDVLGSNLPPYTHLTAEAQSPDGLFNPTTSHASSITADGQGSFVAHLAARSWPKPGLCEDVTTTLHLSFPNGATGTSTQTQHLCW